MKMKKFSIFILALSFALFLSACGTSTDKSEGDTESKKLRVVTDAAYAPFEYMDKGEIVGFDVDFLKAVAKEAGYEYELVHVAFEPLLLEVKDKTADIGISAITINDERKQTYDFSVPYFLSTNKILVPEGSDIKNAADLKDKVVAVQSSTTGQEAVEKLLGKNNKNIKKFENTNLAIMELTSNGADAVVADNTVVEEYAKNNPDKKLIVIEDKGSFEPEYYGLAFPKDSKLKADFDKAINTLYDNGTYAKIYQEWFKSEPDTEDLKTQQKK